MRLLLLAASIFIATPALAQTQAAAPVEPYTYGKRAGVPSNPIVVLTVSQVVTVATLPAACTDGQLAFVADARTPTQGVGKGTGVVARCSSNTWKSLADGSAVQK